MELVSKHGAKKWSVIARSLPGRIGKQCRERYQQDISDLYQHLHHMQLMYAELARYVSKSDEQER